MGGGGGRLFCATFFFPTDQCFFLMQRLCRKFFSQIFHTPPKKNKWSAPKCTNSTFVPPSKSNLLSNTYQKERKSSEGLHPGSRLVMSSAASFLFLGRW